MQKNFRKPDSQSIRSNHAWIAATKFEPVEQHIVLQEILTIVRRDSRKRIQHGGKPIKVVFDLDGTVFDVKPRTLRILKEFAFTSQAQEISKEICDWALGLRAYQLCYTLEESAQMNNIPEHIRRKDFMKAAFEFWKTRFFSHEYVMMDHPVAGAVEYAHAVVNAGGEAVYLTGRDWPGMGKGTRSLLEHWGFPVASHEAELIMKPNAGMDDAEFKDTALRDLRVHSEAVAFFDNEPSNFHVFEKNFPNAFMVFFHSNCSHREAKPVKKIYQVNDFLW